MTAQPTPTLPATGDASTPGMNASTTTDGSNSNTNTQAAVSASLGGGKGTTQGDTTGSTTANTNTATVTNTATGSATGSTSNTTTTNTASDKNVSTTTATTITSNSNSDAELTANEPEAAVVLAFLRKRGLGTAALELQKHLEDKHNDSTEGKSSNKKAKIGDGDDNDDDDDSMAMDVDSKEVARKVEELNEKKTVLNLTTGSGGTGYDLDAAPEILTWGGSMMGASTSTSAKVHIQSGDNDRDSATAASKEQSKEESTSSKADKGTTNDREKWEQDEAIRHVRAFTTLQTWVLALPNNGNGNSGGSNNASLKRNNNASLETLLHHAKVNAGLIGNHSTDNNNNDAATTTTTATPADSHEAITNDDKDRQSTAHIIPNSNGSATSAGAAATATSIGTSNSTIASASLSLLLTPHSIKPELLSLCFPLLIHTYCNLLQSGLEDTAHALLSTYRHIHEPYHPEEFLDLDKCTSQKDMKHLNQLIKGYNDALSKLKTFRAMKDRFKSDYQQQQQKQQQQQSSSASSSNDAQKQAEYKSKLESIDNKEKEIEQFYLKLQSQLKQYPFLKRARSMKWHIHLSALGFHMLVRFFHSGGSNGSGIELLPMSGILQTRCHLVVENRDPVPYVPGFILEDMVLSDETKDGVNIIRDDDESSDRDGGGNGDSGGNNPNNSVRKKATDVRWAAPVDITSRLLEAGEDIDDASSILKRSMKLPFPKYYLQSEYATIDDYNDDKKIVKFNRALLTNGFRRLEALEAKREYEVGVRVRPGSTSSGSDDRKNMVGNPMEPSILFSTLCASSYNSPANHNQRQQQVGKNFSLNESSIDLTCAKLCLPDGRHVAAGCSDAAVRVWSINSWNSHSNKGSVDSSGGLTSPRESSVLLVGHKKGLPVYDIDWNRDGRTLLSAGGDGTIRLWDSKAVGPFGKLSSVTRRSNKSNSSSKKTNKTIYTEPGTHVPGAKPEPMVERYGAALACYQGHAKSTPIWSVAMSPSGYYFASAGSDSTARLWCTDRPTPVRIFMGHVSQNINCLSWHPNCNYIVTGSNDKTVRMWDVQSGQSVRILSGCKFGINQVKVSPSGQYVAGADYGGTVSIWDLRNGRKLNEFRHVNKETGLSPIIHSMSYSPCGSTLATGGDDCSIRLWDARGLGNHKSNPEYAASLGRTPDSVGFQSEPGERDPVKTFFTADSMILDLEFTKRNLLLSVGKYKAPSVSNVT